VALAGCRHIESTIFHRESIWVRFICGFDVRSTPSAPCIHMYTFSAYIHASAPENSPLLGTMRAPILHAECRRQAIGWVSILQRRARGGAPLPRRRMYSAGAGRRVRAAAVVDLNASVQK
jgi:hypothetical protein